MAPSLCQRSLRHNLSNRLLNRFRRQNGVELSAAFLVAFGAIDDSRLSSDVLVTVGLGLSAFVCIALVAGANHLQLRQISKPPLRWFALWLAWAAGSSVFAPTGPSAVLTAGLFAVVAATAIYIYGESGELGLARTLMGAFAIFVVLSVLSKAMDSSVSLGFRGDRLSLLALEANQLVRMAALAALSSACFLLHGARSRSTTRVIAGSIAIVACLAVVVAGQSRTGSAALLTSAVVFAISLAPLAKRRVIAAVGAVSLVLVLGIALAAAGSFADLFGEFESVASREDDSIDQTREIQSLNGRLEIWPEVFSEAAEQPISGYGLGNDRLVVTQLYAEGRIGWLAQHSHNLLLQVLLTTGFVGLVLMLVAFVSTSARAFDANSPLGPALLVLVLIDGITEAAIRVPSFGWFALMAAAAVAASGETVTQLSAEKTVLTSSSISSTARS